MPPKMEEIRRAVQKKGASKDDAYAIAQAQYKKLKKKKKKGK